jgi:hypothetical protein
MEECMSKRQAGKRNEDKGDEKHEYWDFIISGCRRKVHWPSEMV